MNRTSFTVGTLLALSPSVASQDSGAALIRSAAQQLNAVAPQAVMNQTIQIGRFDCASGDMLWNIPYDYPPSTPENKKAENGGPVQPRAMPGIRSYDLSYEIQLANKPAGLAVTLERLSSAGTLEVIATASFPSSSTARLDYHPQETGRQYLRFANCQGQGVFSLWPTYQPELGGFVVPNLLIAIVYEPPGALSSAKYAQSSTSGTTVTFGFASASGLVHTEEPGALVQMCYDGIAAAAGSFSGPMGKAVEIISGLQESTMVHTTTETSTASESSIGTEFTVSTEFATGLHQYPGGGDRFVVLSDVLFAYLVQNGVVHLAPVAYSQVRGMTAAELESALPAADFQRFVSLDPHLAGGLPVLGQASSPSWIALAMGGSETRKHFGSPRYVHFATWPCERSGANVLELRKSDMHSSGMTKTTTQTTLYETAGLIASLSGDSGSTSKYSYSSSKVEYAEDDVAATISLWCGPDEEPFACEVWYDQLFRTFLCTKGSALVPQSQAIVSGEVSDEQGLPRPSERVTLVIGDRRYMTATDAQGRFRFPFADLPRGRGALLVGLQAWSLELSGAPLTGVRLGLARDGSKLSVPAGADPGRGPQRGSDPGLPSRRGASQAPPALPRKGGAPSSPSEEVQS